MTGEPNAIFPSRDPDVFYDLTRGQLAIQLETLDAIDNKVGLLFSTSSALLGILAAVFALKPGKLGLWEYLALGGFVALYLIVCWQSERAYRARNWKTGPDLKQVYREHKRPGDDRELKWRIANHFRIDYEKNQKLANLKSEALQLILPCVMTQTLILVLALILVAEAV
jgi:hypothetical protein